MATSRADILLAITRAAMPAASASAGHGDQNRQLLPPRARLGLPGRSNAARLEQPQGRVDALGHAQLLYELRMLAAVALEIVRAPDRQAAGDVALGDLVAQDELAVHLHGLAASPESLCVALTAGCGGT